MDEKMFVWTPELTEKMFNLRFEYDWIFKKKKQPWGAFYKILRASGYPEEMTINHVRKKWSYTYDMYRIAKKTKNKDWKYYEIFDGHFGKTTTLDKYESWSDEWRLKFIESITTAKNMCLEFHVMWKTIETAMRSLDLPIDCCIQDMKGLWHHLRMTFNRKHRLKIKKGAELTEWPLYDSMLNYYQKFDQMYLQNLESDTAYDLRLKSSSVRHKKRNKDTDNNDNENDEFQWSRDITETFIQIRLQNDWLFRERKWAWKELLSIMIGEYGFPKTLSARDLSRKWSATCADYQKAKATNNKSWLYYTLFEVYLGEGGISLEPLIGWQEEWVFNLISARTDLHHLFKFNLQDRSEGWRDVEKRLRCIGLPLNHSLLDLPLIWTHLLKTFKWKTKFASQGILSEQWPYFEAIGRYKEIENQFSINTRKQEENSFEDCGIDDDYEDDMKLFDLKRKLLVKPKFEFEDLNQCRSCCHVDGCVDLFEQKDNDGLDLAYKLKVIGGIQVDKSDNLPSRICFECLQELENAYKFRRKCQDVDQQLRSTAHKVKVEILDKHEVNDQKNNNNDDLMDLDKHGADDMDTHFDVEVTNDSESHETKPVKVEKRKLKMKKQRKLRYDYWKICEVCGKHTRNLISHLDAHSKGRPYSCEVCDKKFKFKSGLIVHKAVHEPTPRKTCEVCGKTFHIIAQYRRHFVYHANERKYGCETCGKRFNTMDILKVHNRTHTDERPFSCQDCGKTFRTAGCVSRHRRIVHRNIKVQ